MSDQPMRIDETQGAVVHEYDGIEECDNRLPNWWLATLFITIGFSAVYWFYYHVFEVGRLPRDAYAAAANTPAPNNGANATAAITDEMLEAMAKDAGAVEAGKKAFAANCVACHLAKGEGSIGPNLTDNAWIHGGKPIDIYKTIKDGVVEKGMLAWGPVLGDTTVQQLTAFVLTIRNTNVPGKAPQGEPYEPDKPSGS